MATEKERKFLLRYMPEGLKGYEIEQGYLMLSTNRHLRIRLVNKRAFLCFKIFLSSEYRLEFEYEIRYTDGLLLSNNCMASLRKQRYETEYKGNKVAIDIYPHGLKIVEIEYDSELTDLPDYCGEEVTGIEEYSNIFLSYAISTKT
jgi:CYTH domain-containing protein